MPMAMFMACAFQFRSSFSPAAPPPLCDSSSTPLLTRAFDFTPVLKKVGISLRDRQLKAAPREQVGNDEETQMLMAIQSSYNDIVVLDTPDSRLLFLDSTHNVHSVFKKGSKWTDSYWDEFVTLPAIVPEGPIAIFGLGGGTAAHLMLDSWPSLQLEGWEIDEILIHISRDFLGLSEVEKQTINGGVLNVHIGDVFSPDAAIFGGYAGIIVDLFAEGKILPELEQPSTWLNIYNKLKPNGRFMVNCGADKEGSSAENAVPQHGGSSQYHTWKLNATIRALCNAFPGQVNWKKMPKSAGENYLALTGPLPDLSAWSATVPSELKSSVYQWQTCSKH